MSSNLATVAYIGATILFILSLGGLSNPETSRRGNVYGIVGMAIAVLATTLGPRVTAIGIPWIVGALAVGGSIGLYLARKVQMTQMPELVALMHSLVGLAAVFVATAAFYHPEAYGIGSTGNGDLPAAVQVRRADHVALRRFRAGVEHGILIEAEEQGTLTLSAFDYEVSARITVAADVAEGGTVLVHGKLPTAAELKAYKAKLQRLRGIPVAVQDVLDNELLPRIAEVKQQRALAGLERDARHPVDIGQQPDPFRPQQIDGIDRAGRMTDGVEAIAHVFAVAQRALRLCVPD